MAPSDEGERQTLIVASSEHGLRIDRWLALSIPAFSRAWLQALIEEGCVTQDGHRAKSCSLKVKAGERWDIELRPTQETLAFRPEAMPLEILWEDDDLLVLNKAPGMVVHPAAGHWGGTLLNGLLAHHAGAGSLPRAGIVHRLDKDTSGLMVVGKSITAVTALVRAMAAREVLRQYLAVTHGEGMPEYLDLSGPIGRDPASRIKMACVSHGKPARTEVFRCAQGQGGTAVRCRLHTGRTHQIRVHLSQRGFPLIGDALYGGRAKWGMERQALHAARLSLKHPITGESLDFQCAPPSDFLSAWGTVAPGVEPVCPLLPL